MSQTGSQPAAGGSATGKNTSSTRFTSLGSNVVSRAAELICAEMHHHMLITCLVAPSSSAQPLAPPPRTSSREPSLQLDGTNGRTAGSSTGQEDVGTGQIPNASTQANDKGDVVTGAGEDTANGKAESIGRRSKRSITGRRKRDESAANEKPSQQAAPPNEKDTRPTSAGGTGSANQSRPKKKGGFLSFLNCCAAPEESQEVGQSETAQPAKAPKSQPIRAQQPTQARQNQNVSTAGTSADDSKEVIDEKDAQTSSPDAGAEPVSSTAISEKPPQGDATVDKPVPNLPADAPAVQPNSEVRPLDSGKQAMVPETPVTGPPHVDTSTQSREASDSSQSPQLQVQAPTPVVAQQEDEMILDRTPEQAQRDNDMEMSDSGPSLPLTGQDAAVVVEEEKQAHERKESSGVNREDLPPPPPMQARQEQQHDGAAVSHETSVVSTPEPPQKWLLPPIRNEFRGRKCLVLDLDETLVHSSFKVSTMTPMHEMYPSNGSSRSSTRQTLQFRSKLKVNTIMSTLSNDPASMRS